MLSDFHTVMLYMTLTVRHHVLSDCPLISVYDHILSGAVKCTLYTCCISCKVLVGKQTLLHCIREVVFFPHCGYHHHHYHHHPHVVCLTCPYPLQMNSSESAI